MCSNVLPRAVAFLDFDGVFSDRLHSGDTRNRISRKMREIQETCPIYSDRSFMTEGKSYHLICRRAQVACLSDEAIGHLKSLSKRVLEELGMQLEFVISSSWKDQISFEEVKEHVLADAKWLRKRTIDKTPDSDSDYDQLKRNGHFPQEEKTPSDVCFELYGFRLGSMRGRQIEFWLRQHKERLKCQSYVILDDNCTHSSEIALRHPKRFVEVDPDNLFTQQDADKAFAILAQRSQEGLLEFSSQRCASSSND